MSSNFPQQSRSDKGGQPASMPPGTIATDASGYLKHMSEHHKDLELQPIPQTREAFDWLNVWGNDEIESSMTRMAKRVHEMVPDCLAMSLTVSHGQLTFTLMTDRPGAALLDAMQYLDGGPCVRAVENNEVIDTSELALDEGRWQLFARAEAVAGISSTLSLPVVKGGKTVGGVNLYGSNPTTFDGHHEDLAEACGGWAEGAVTDADLSFSSRIRAAATPGRLVDRGIFDIASGVVAAHQEIEVSEAAVLIHEAASRAGVTHVDFARFIIAAQDSRAGGD